MENRDARVVVCRAVAAPDATVLTLIMRRGVVLTAIGVALGLAAAATGTRVDPAVTLRDE